MVTRILVQEMFTITEKLETTPKSTDRRIITLLLIKLWYIQPMESYPAVKMNKLLLKTWTYSLESILYIKYKLQMTKYTDIIL